MPRKVLPLLSTPYLLLCRGGRGITQLASEDPPDWSELPRGVAAAKARVSASV